MLESTRASKLGCSKPFSSAINAKRNDYTKSVSKDSVEKRFKITRNYW